VARDKKALAFPIAPQIARKLAFANFALKRENSWLLMITRYTRPEMGAIWTDQGRLERWLEVELAATDTLAERGVVPRAAAARIRERARVDAARVPEIESRVRHDVIAFTLAVGEAIGDPEAARWLHYGLTSNDVVDT